jgi:hypothetical protein
MGVTPQVTVRPIFYLVSVWPDGHECSDAATWCLTVAYRGRGQWTVEQGWSEGRGQKPVMDVGGRWHTDRPGHPGLRFSLDRALELASRHAPAVRKAGITAAEALRLHDAHGCPEER